MVFDLITLPLRIAAAATRLGFEVSDRAVGALVHAAERLIGVGEETPGEAAAPAPGGDRKGVSLAVVVAMPAPSGSASDPAPGTPDPAPGPPDAELASQPPDTAPEPRRTCPPSRSSWRRLPSRGPRNAPARPSACRSRGRGTGDDRERDHRLPGWGDTGRTGGRRVVRGASPPAPNGATIAAIIVGIVTLFYSFPTDTIVWVIVVIVYQQIENNVPSPIMYRHTVQVPGMLVLVSVLIGATLSGVIGALLAISAAAAVQIVMRDVWQQRKTRPAPAESRGGLAS